MTLLTSQVPTRPAAGSAREQRSRPRRPRSSSEVISLLAQGEPFLWLTGGALVLCVVMILALLILVAVLGLSTFHPAPLLQLQLRDGRTLLGEVTKTEHYDLTAERLLGEPDQVEAVLLQQLVDEFGGDLASLPDQLQQSCDRLARRIADVQQRIAWTGERVDRLSQRATDSSRSPFERSRDIAARHSDVSLVKARAEWVALEERLVALQQERQTLQAAAQYFAAPERCNIAALRAAEPSLQQAGVAALLDRVAAQRGDEAVRVRRRMLRTGNFELTNEHFQWVSDYEVVDQGSSYPDLAATVERISWGRFYGTPQRFTLRQLRDASGAELQLAQILELLQTHRAQFEAPDATLLDQQLQTLQAEHAAARRRGIEEFLASRAQAADSLSLTQLETAPDQLKTFAELTDQDEVSAVVMTWDKPETAWQQYQRHHHAVRTHFHQQQQLEKHELGRIYAQQERARLQVRQAELEFDVSILNELQPLLAAEQQSRQQQQELVRVEAMVAQIRQRFGDQAPITQLARSAREHRHGQLQQQQQTLEQTTKSVQAILAVVPEPVRQAAERQLEVERASVVRSREIQQQIEQLRADNARYQLHMVTSDGRPQSLAVADIVRAYLPNRMSTMQQAGVYLSRWWEFLVAEPREANSEGGVLPAIWGTVTMTLIMTLAVVPFGVLASLYLREYAKSGVIVSAIRIAINNLAGVPSIVFGVFGLGFFCYIVGAYLDGGPRNAGFLTLPPARWYFGAGVLAVVSLVAFLIGLLSLTGRHGARSTSKQWLGYGALGLWLISLGLLCYLLIKSPFFGGFYEAHLPNPYWGKGGVVWAALTLALMTLPVVIVATEEALSAVPNSMREGSYGCGASKWQTIRRIVLPQALPGIMTGLILAMARGAGEVAPLMLVGAVKMAPELPLDTVFPFLHGNRSFMHLGFHIFDVGFQSQNSEAAKPMVYTATLLLIVIITLLNLMAVQLRAYLRKRFVSGQF